MMVYNVPANNKIQENITVCIRTAIDWWSELFQWKARWKSKINKGW